MYQKEVAVPVKLCAFFSALIGTSLKANTLLTFVLVIACFIQLVSQYKWKQLLSYLLFYLFLTLLLYLIRFHNLRMLIFSEFYVLMVWNLFPVFILGWDLITTPPGSVSAFLSRIHIPTNMILGLLVIFRFFPTMKSELNGVVLSMRNRGITKPIRILLHPAISCEYLLVPLLLRSLQIADQLSISAIARGAESPTGRSSYYEKEMTLKDYFLLIFWVLLTISFILFKGRYI